jgi:sugar O-acyltransferase (sialic acid O-acetyltransferase NeuD family)
MKSILLIGGGGHCKSVIDVIESGAKYRVIGVVQPLVDGPAHVLGYPVLGDDEALIALLIETPCAIVTVGQVKQAALRQRLFNKLLEMEAEIPVITSPNAYVSKHAHLGAGSVVMHGAVLNAHSVVAENCIINSMALVEHDVRIGPHCHISTGARLNGGVQIGAGCFIGSGAVIHQGVSIGEAAVIGAGCVINGDIAAHTTTWYEA